MGRFERGGAEASRSPGFTQLPRRPARLHLWRRRRGDAAKEKRRGRLTAIRSRRARSIAAAVAARTARCCHRRSDRRRRRGRRASRVPQIGGAVIRGSVWRRRRLWAPLGAAIVRIFRPPGAVATWAAPPTLLSAASVAAVAATTADAARAAGTAGAGVSAVRRGELEAWSPARRRCRRDAHRRRHFASSAHEGLVVVGKVRGERGREKSERREIGKTHYK